MRLIFDPDRNKVGAGLGVRAVTREGSEGRPKGELYLHPRFFIVCFARVTQDELMFSLSIHQRGRTFSTTVILSQGVRLEAVNKMFDHKQITITQIYAKITDDKIGKDMEELNEKIAGKFRVAR